MKKKLLITATSLALISTTALSSFALEPAKNVNTKIENVNTNTSDDPKISIWHFQANKPLIGNASDYTVLKIKDNKRNLSLYKDLCDCTTYYLAGKLAGTLIEDAAMANAASSTIVNRVNSNASLYREPSIYCLETRYALNTESGTNYKVIQKWYGDAAYKNYITTTTYYASFY